MKSKFLGFVISIVFLTMFSSPLLSKDMSDEKIYFNVSDADIKDVVLQIGKAMGKNFIMDDRVRGKITIQCEEPMTTNEAYETFLAALGAAGYTIVDRPGNVTEIIPLKDAAESPIPVYDESMPEKTNTNRFITRLIPIKYVSVLDVSTAVKGLIDRHGKIFAYPASNTLVVSDFGVNIDRIMDVIREIDREKPPLILQVIPVRKASGKKIVDFLEFIFKEKGRKKTDTFSGIQRLMFDEDTNSVVLYVSKDFAKHLKQIVEKLDEELGSAEKKSFTIDLIKPTDRKDTVAKKRDDKTGFFEKIASLFKAKRKKDEKIKPAEDKTENNSIRQTADIDYDRSQKAIRTSLPIKVLTTLSVGNGRDSRSSAAISYGRDINVYKVGDTLRSGTVLIHVTPKRIEFVRDGRLEYAEVMNEAEIVSEKVKSETENRLPDLNKLYTMIRAVPNFSDGKVKGLKILSIKPDSIFEKIGLKRGDVWLKTNGIKLDIKKGIDIVADWKDKNKITVEIIRNNSPKTLEYEMKK